jgi:hypothetical protein
MYQYKSIVRLSLFFLFMGLNIGNSQDILGAFGLDLGYLSPVGKWKEHLYAPGVDQFGGGMLYGAEFEFNLLDVNWGVFINYTKLDMSDWENYPGNVSPVSASASMYIYGAVFKYYAVNQSPHYINLDIGLAFTDFKGHESYSGYSYEYDFIKTRSKINLLIGLAYKYKMNKNLAFQLGGRMVFIPSGIEYADGKDHDILVLPLSLGIRYLF